ncbi:hypothetical protein BK004_04470 [bacterium CG10_46_32]|nr:MAG: hypothetical protein BK004_04470 [bacterium CG10_46_32]PIR55764.1 MAG: hypothetical protein COU73_04510 [Parcubacteria group bacterium CG10_big_fil_rev_8_21_14_0_10_46_32]
MYPPRVVGPFFAKKGDQMLVIILCIMFVCILVGGGIWIATKEYPAYQKSLHEPKETIARLGPQWEKFQKDHNAKTKKGKFARELRTNPILKNERNGLRKPLDKAEREIAALRRNWIILIGIWTTLWFGCLIAAIVLKQ